jgi:hypothetical protein
LPSTLQSQRFKELVLYFAAKSADDPGFGAVKLNKLLFFSDFEAHRTLGRSLTGAKYQKLRWGPAAIEFLPMQDELLRDGLATVETRQRGSHEQRVTVAIAEPDLRLFSDEEMAIVDRVLDWLGDRGAMDVSDLSHERSAGWKLVEEGEVIPYDTAFISTAEPKREMIRHAERLARDRNWIAVRP